MSNDPSPPAPEDEQNDGEGTSRGTNEGISQRMADEPTTDASDDASDEDAEAAITHDNDTTTETAADTETNPTTETTVGDTIPDDSTPGDVADEPPEIPPEVQKYARFKKMDGAEYDRVNEFLRDRTYITAREWAIARLCADFRTETGVEMTKIGDNLPYLVPFMTDTYTPQAVNQARSAFEEKIRKAGATFLYGAMSGFFTAEELDDVMYEVTEVAKFLLEVEGVDLAVEDELAAEDRISSVMREVRESSEELRHDEMECPHCGREIGGEE